MRSKLAKTANNITNFIGFDLLGLIKASADFAQLVGIGMHYG